MTQEPEVDWAADGAAQVAAAEAAAEAAKQAAYRAEAELISPANSVIQNYCTAGERVAATRWQANHWLAFISEKRRAAAKAAREARRELDVTLLALCSEREERAAEAAEQAAEAVRDEYARAVIEMEALYRRGKDWRSARPREINR
jgi:hypothetical protein